MNKLANIILCVFLLTGTFLLKGADMAKNKDPVNFLFNHKPGRFKSLEPDEELLKLEGEILQRELTLNSDIQQWMGIAKSGKEINGMKTQLKLRHKS